MKIGIIGAMELEVEILKSKLENLYVQTISKQEFYCGNMYGHDCFVVKSGIGKVNMALCTQTMILNFAPDLIINTGVAGSIADCLKIGDIVVGEYTVEHDFDISALGEPLGYISELDTVKIPCSKKYSDLLFDCAKKLGINVHKGVIASGDQFVHTDAQREHIKTNFDGMCAEMEGGAMGHVCAMNNMPYAVIRAISDSANDDSKVDFPTFARQASDVSVKILNKFLKSAF